MTASDADGPIPGYYDSPFPGEDGGPRRQMIPRSSGPGIEPGAALGVVSRPLLMTTMIVLRDPGEVFVQGNTPPSPEAKGWVEKVDPDTLETRRRSPDLEGGPFWPGGMLAHANGYLYMTFGRWCHKLDPDCNPVASRMLPRAMPYNSLVALSDGVLVMKNFVRDGSSPSYFTLLDPGSLQPAGPEVAIPEGSIARISRDISEDGEFVYVVGDHTFFRYRYEHGRLARDDAWTCMYRTLPDGEQSYGWDPVIAGGFAWFLDNGANQFRSSLRGRGMATGPVHLHRVSTADAPNHTMFAPFGLPHGTVTNPPLIDAERQIAVTYDSGNARIAGFRYGDAGYERLWDHPFGAANHFLLYPDTGEIAVNDFDGTAEHLVVLDIETGREKARAPTGSAMQSVVFQSPGWSRDIYTASLTTFSRVWTG
ncbi:MAG: hypothetical protein HY873_14285 [Chloroflexi bacterium]|nr:hypothetical protein [Chloroflexota bacterium]